MKAQKIVVIGASAGGVEALMEIARQLQADLAAPVFVVLHIPPDSPSILPKLLDRNGRLAAKSAEDGERYRNGTIYVAPPDRHLLVERDGTLRTVHGPRENRHRPAVDPLFHSAALVAGANAIGVILTGTLDDGTAGLLAIKQSGGVAIVQDPKDAMYPGMPMSAMEHVDVDHCVPLMKIADRIVEAVNDGSRRETSEIGANLMDIERRITAMDSETMQDENRPGKPSAFSCPDCGGVLWEIEDGEYTRYRCRVGHAFSPEAMFDAQNDQIEEALWSALKTLEENAQLSRRLAASENVRGHEWMVKRFQEREEEARKRAELIRQFLLSQSGAVPVEAPRENVR